MSPHPVGTRLPQLRARVAAADEEDLTVDLTVFTATAALEQLKVPGLFPTAPTVLPAKFAVNPPTLTTAPVLSEKLFKPFRKPHPRPGSAPVRH